MSYIDAETPWQDPTNALHAAVDIVLAVAPRYATGVQVSRRLKRIVSAVKALSVDPHDIKPLKSLLAASVWLSGSEIGNIVNSIAIMFSHAGRSEISNDSLNQNINVSLVELAASDREGVAPAAVLRWRIRDITQGRETPDELRAAVEAIILTGDVTAAYRFYEENA